jgi:hypothetical protein
MEHENNRPMASRPSMLRLRALGLFVTRLFVIHLFR